MKRTFLTLICGCLAYLSNAQIAKWLIEPSYDNIRMAGGIDAIITDSVNTKILWTYDGERLLETSNDFFDFKENRSVSIIPDSKNIACIFKDNGDCVKVENCSVAHAFPYYSCGKLLVMDSLYYR